jgi:hypothetical protein
MRTPKNFRLPSITCNQLTALAKAWGVSQSQVLILLLDRETCAAILKTS